MRFLSLILFASYIQSTDYIDYPHPFHPTTTSSGMVVSQNALSSNIGIKILDMGGNAVDAAVAVGFSLATTLPRAGNIGGGGFMLIYLEDKDEIFYIGTFNEKEPLSNTIQRGLNWLDNYTHMLQLYSNEGSYVLVESGEIYSENRTSTD